MPGALDRKGTRRLLQTLSPALVLVLVHRGRRSGKLYKTPLEALASFPERGEIVVAPLWGEDSDWYRNVLAGGLVEIHVKDEVRKVEWRRLTEAERREAADAYKQAHPRYSRLILRMIARVNRLEGDPEAAAVAELPMLGLRQVDG